jgi:hypothetical protein
VSVGILFKAQLGMKRHTTLLQRVEIAACLIASLWVVYDGCATDPSVEKNYIALSAQKARTEIPTEDEVIDVTVDTVAHWSGNRAMPPAGLRRERWSDEDRGYVYMQEWRAVRMTGYLQSADNQPDGDLHMYICDSAYGDLSRSVVVEMTSHFRQIRPWQLYGLQKYFHQSVRVTGWLMFDEEHSKGADRANVWEIHPVTKFEVSNNGTWQDLQ